MLVNDIIVDKEKTSENIRCLMKKNGHTVGQLVELTGLTKNTISNYRNGHNVHNMHNLGVIAKVYGVDIDEIIVYKTKDEKND